MEFRLAFMHYGRKNEYRRRNDAQMADMLACIFCVAGISRITDESRQKIMDIARGQQDELFNLLSLVGKEPEKRQREANHLAGQQAYAEALTGLGKFNSLDQLNAAITALNETIKENIGSKADNNETGK